MKKKSFNHRLLGGQKMLLEKDGRKIFRTRILQNGAPKKSGVWSHNVVPWLEFISLPRTTSSICHWIDCRRSRSPASRFLVWGHKVWRFHELPEGTQTPQGREHHELGSVEAMKFRELVWITMASQKWRTTGHSPRTTSDREEGNLEGYPELLDRVNWLDFTEHSKSNQKWLVWREVTIRCAQRGAFSWFHHHATFLTNYILITKQRNVSVQQVTT